MNGVKIHWVLAFELPTDLITAPGGDSSRIEASRAELRARLPLKAITSSSDEAAQTGTWPHPAQRFHVLLGHTFIPVTLALNVGEIVERAILRRERGSLWTGLSTLRLTLCRGGDESRIASDGRGAESLVLESTAGIDPAGNDSKAMSGALRACEAPGSVRP